MLRKQLNKKERFAEAELRVLSAIAFDNEPDRAVLEDLYKNCKLNEPYMCADAELVRNSNIGFYFSTVYLIARSDALLYVPGVAAGGVGLDQIFNERDLVCLNDHMRSKEKGRGNARAASERTVNEYRDTLKELLGL